MIKEATALLIDKKDLTYTQASEVIDEIMTAKASQIQTAAFLAALSAKGETVDEITGCASAMRAQGERITCDYDLLEIVGTGGDCSNSFNISTTSSIVIAAAGIKVAKHGNRSASSKSGAADCLEALGANINLTAEQCLEVLDELGLCFLFAQTFHSSMKNVAPVRKELGVRTVFNILGPLTNPASANIQVLGVYSEELVEPLAKVLYNLGVKRGMVVFGQDVLDEISMSAPTTVCEFSDGEYNTYTICPEDFGLTTCEKSELVGGTPAENAQITLSILNGEKGARRDAVLLNSGAGIYIAGNANSLREGIQKAAEIIDSGKAKALLDGFIAKTNSFGEKS